MREINRSVAIIRPRQLFIEWANSLPDADRKLSLDDFGNDRTTVLIAPYDDDEEAWARIGEIWEDLFEEELSGWCTHEAWWPTGRDERMFRQWFDVEFHSMVFVSQDGPISEEP